ncbi:Fasciclin-1 [Nymphon striatum]|nr:Fasciclin-1 [Nymphon striatum]
MFNELLGSVGWFEGYLTSQGISVFAPTNKAFETYLENYPDLMSDAPGDLLQCYILKASEAEESFFNAKSSKTSMLGTHMWFTKVKKPNSVDKYDYYVNDAKILNFDNPKTYDLKNGKRQTLYIIDKALGTLEGAGDAMSFLKDPKKFGFKSSLGAFRSRVEKQSAQSLFEMGNGNTYFIPVGDFGEENFNEVDKIVIRGHIIPNQVLFTRTMNSVYRSDMYDATKEGVKVELSLMNATNELDQEFTLRVKSNTMVSRREPSSSGPRLPKKGVVLSDILDEGSNIAVSNGVIHLIKDPLMIINTNILQILEREQNGRLSEFMKFLDKADENLRFQFSNPPDKTLFVPTNEAFKMVPSEKLNDIFYQSLQGPTKLIQLHMVPNSISSDDVYSDKQNTNIPSMDNSRPLYFNVFGPEGNRTFSVEGGGVNATAIEADIGATNGIVHIINQVLGVPFRTIFDKLKADAKLSVTYGLGEGSKWNEIFRNNRRNFTIFVPNNKAWKKLENEHPTTYKQLDLKGEFNEHIPKILDRHIILDQVLTLEELLKKSTVKTKGATLKVLEYKFPSTSGNSKVDDTVHLSWGRGKKAQITRHDVQATNGIIHVIDNVFMERDDIASGVDMAVASIVTLLISAFIFKFIV